MSVNHYENFPVASLFCPAALRPAVAAIYWFARTADDLADEGDQSTAQRLADLSDYRADLQAVAAGASPSARWSSVFAPLAAVIQQHHLSIELLTDLLSAFEQDLFQSSYPDRAGLLDYCRRSANPIGRLLLQLYGVNEPQALAQSDAICSALQLINFWQDLSVDISRGRLYLPVEDCAAEALNPAQVLAGTDSPALRAVLKTLVQWTNHLMHSGAPLAHRLPGRVGWELRLVVQGGLRVLEKIEAMNFQTIQSRPTLRTLDAPRLVWRALCMKHMPLSHPNPSAQP
jgi:hydroxysqualene synthase